ncbi:MAG: class I SAM-dependent methyltransferase [Myxococcota bacterium]
MRPGAAALYDYIYAYKDYEGDAQKIHLLLNEAGVGNGSDVLEAACGTARYLECLQPWFSVSGFDLDREMLRQAAWRVPGGDFFQANMETFQPGRVWDALLCLFGGVGYLDPEEGLLRGLLAFHTALRPGGVLLVEPWVTPERFEPGKAWMQTYTAPNFKLARLVVPRLEGRQCVLEFHFQVARGGGRVEQLRSTERLWLHPLGLVVDCAREIGFSVELTRQGFMADGHLLICKRN